jgi:hypothetical protein
MPNDIGAALFAERRHKDTTEHPRPTSKNWIELNRPVSNPQNARAKK